MGTSLVKIIDTVEAQTLLTAGLRLVSTQRQLDNGTIVLSGTVRKQPVHYTITASGAVLSNKFVIKNVSGAYPLQQYRAGLKVAGQLLAKRLSA